MGANGNGQLGDGTLTKTNLPEQIVSNGVTTVAAGTYHSLFLKSVPLDSSRSLWAMGANDSGQLGDNNPIFAVKRPEQILAGGVTAIAAGYGYSLFLQFDGSLWGMGGNDYGQLGDNAPNDHVFLPKQIFPAPVQPVGLSIQLSASALILAWPTNLAGFNLQSTTNLISPVWTTNLSAPVVVNGQYTLTNPIAGTQFFRLSQ
jgi:alpha-tubulin suppressor-like RCC1 family protein